MRSGSSLGLALLCWVFGEVVAYDPLGLFRGEAELWRYGGDPSLGQPRTFSQPWAWVDVSQLQAMAPLHPVAVQCQEAQLVVTVHRDLFGTGRLVRAADLSLGSASCLPVVWSTSETTVTFVAGLHECGSTLRVTPDSLIYTTSLNYSPVLPSNPVVIRTSPAVVPIECHYPRRDNVSSHGVKPTWAPFRYTLSSEEKLPFSLRLMSDDWSAERASAVFQLGEVFHFQAGVDAENHVPLRLFVDSCVATLTPDRTSSPQYAFIEFSGCLVDGQVDDATSTFISPRPRQDVLQFAVDAFKFAGDSSNLIYVTCHLKVSPADQAPDPLNKACSFNKASNLEVGLDTRVGGFGSLLTDPKAREAFLPQGGLVTRLSSSWDPVEGTRDICSCCEMRSCGLARHSGRFHAPSRWPGARVRRELPSQPDPLVKEADVVVGPLLIHSWQDHTARRVPSQAAGHLWMVWGLAAVAGLVILILAVLGALTVCQKPSNPV